MNKLKSFLNRIYRHRYIVTLRQLSTTVIWRMWKIRYKYYEVLNDESSYFSKTYFQGLIVKISDLFFDLPYAFLFRYKYSRLVKSVKKNRLEEPSKGLCLMISSLAPGGAERQVVTTLLGLNKLGASNLSLLCHNLKTENQNFYLPDLKKTDIRITELDRSTCQDQFFCEHALNRFFGSAFFYRHEDATAFSRTILAENPKILHLWLDDNNVIGGLVAVCLGVPKIVLCLRSLAPNNFIFHKPYYREAYKWLVTQPNVVLVNNSHAGALSYEKWLGLKKGAIQVVHNGYDFDSKIVCAPDKEKKKIFEQLGIPSDAPVVGTIMRMSEEKRPLLWVKYASEIKKIIPTAHFIFVGNGMMYDEVIDYAGQLDLDGNIHFMGYQEDTHKILPAFDLFLLTSRAEGFPNVSVEAQAQGVPCVVTNRGGAPETLKHNITGCVLDNEEPGHVALKIKSLLDNDVWMKNAKKESPEWVKSHLNNENMLSGMLKVYQDDSLLEISA